MARPSLERNPKWKGLVRRIGSKAIARGSLEFIWDSANESGDTVFRSTEAVEDAAWWDGKPGVLVDHLVSVGFLDDIGDGRYEIHDFWDHCPDYVRKRHAREQARKQRTVTGQRPVSGEQRPSLADNGSTPSPTPSPTLKIEDSNESSGEKIDRINVESVKWSTDEYNKIASKHGLPQVQRLTNRREKAVRARLNEYGKEAVCCAIAAIGKSKFLQGQNGRESWTGATFDWLMRPSNFVKVLEGNYADKKSKPFVEPEYDAQGYSRAERGLV